MSSYYYDFRDIFRAPRIALHGKNIFLQLVNMVTGYVGYAVLAYVALLAEGINMSFAWDVHFLFPIGTLGLVSTWARLIWILGVLWFLFWLLRGNIAVAKTSFEEIRGNLFYSSMEARSFVKEKKGILYRAFLAVIGFVVFVVALGLIAGLIGWIPVVGEISFGLFYGFPYYIVSLFAVLVLFLLVTFFLTGPTVVGVKGEDTLTALFDGFSTVTSRPLRWSIYTASSIIIAKVCSFVLFYFSFRAFQFTNYTTGVFMGEKSKILFESACNRFPMNSPVVEFLSYLYPGSDFGINMYLLGAFHQSDTAFTISIYLLVISIGLVFAFIISYFINTLVISQVIAFIDIRRQTHDELLAELPEDEMWDDFEIPDKKEKPAGDDTSTETD
jgi:hypothetical protein